MRNLIKIHTYFAQLIHRREVSFCNWESYTQRPLATNLRKYILNNNKIVKIDSFPERDSKKKRVFEEEF